MKKIISLALISACVFIIPGSALFAGNSKKQDDAWKKVAFTAGSLKQYNGKNGKPIYVAVDGIVYDFSKAGPWKKGKHMNMHDPGADLSADFHNKAPRAIHSRKGFLDKFPRVGVLLGTSTVSQERPAR